jgi:hypothetical protein
MVIICYNLSMEVEPGKYIGFQKNHNHLVSRIPGGQNIDRFGKLVNGSEDPLVLYIGGWIYITHEI